MDSLKLYAETPALRLRQVQRSSQLFALRAMANRPLPKLRRAEADPAAAYARGDYGSLAAPRAVRAGLRSPV